MQLGLSAREEAEAAATPAHVIWYVYVEEDAAGEDVSWGIPVAVCSSVARALADVARRSGPPLPEGNASGHYVCDEPCNLLAFAHTFGLDDGVVVRAVLRGETASLPPRVWYSPSYYRQYTRSSPLLSDERERACALKVWTVYYQDHFHVGPSRESRPAAICFSAAEAEAEADRRGRLEPGFDGHVVQGPSPLLLDGHATSEVGADVIREVLRRSAVNEPGPVPVS